MDTFTVHVTFTLHPDTTYAVDLVGRQPVRVVLAEVAQKADVDIDDITLHYEGGQLEPGCCVSEVGLGEGSVVEARPSRRFEARNVLKEAGLLWDAGAMHIVVNGDDSDEEKAARLRLMLDAGGEADGEAVCYAAQMGCLETLKVLMCGGHDAALGTNGWGPLPVAAYSGRLAVVRHLVTHGASIGTPNSEGQTPAQLAALNGQLDVLQYLISQGADLDKADKDGRTPLSAACGFGRLNTVQCLVEHGADTTKPDLSGATPHDIAKMMNRTEVAEYLATYDKAL